MQLIEQLQFDWFLFMQDRFQNTDNIYKTFVRILINRTKNGMSVDEIFREASVIYLFVSTN